MQRKIFSICMSFILAVGLCPLPAFADAKDDALPSASSTALRATGLSIGESTVIQPHETGSDYTAELAFTNSGIQETHAGSGYSISGTTLTITKAGTYFVTGSCTEGSIEVKKEVEGAVLFLSDLTLASSSTAPVVVKKSASATLHVAGTTMLLDNENPANETSSDTAVAEAFEGAAVKVKSGASLTFCGDGTLVVNSSTCKNGIKGAATSTLTFNAGTYAVTAANNGIAADGNLVFNGGSFTIDAENDGIKAVPDETDTESAGTVTVNGGTFDIDVNGDGVQAETLVVNGGTFDIKTMGGYGDSSFNSDTMSCKGLKASGDRTTSANDMSIANGTFALNTADDAVHSDGNIAITGGIFDIYTGDDGVHADGNLKLGSEDGLDRDPAITVNASYEGLEGSNVYVYSGRYDIAASDDGVNAAGGSSNGSDPGAPGSQGGAPSRPAGMGVLGLQAIGGPGQQPGGGMAGGGGSAPGAPGGPGSGSGSGGSGGFNPGAPGTPSTSGDYNIYVYGGKMRVNCDGDGLDSNGGLYLYGGEQTVFSQRGGQDNSPFDSDGTWLISGATTFGAGGNSMNEMPASTSQYYYTNSTSRSANTAFAISHNGSVVFSDTLPKAVNYLVYSSPNMTSSTCAVTTGTRYPCVGDSWSHTWDSGVTTNGITTYTCTVCGEIEQQTALPNNTAQACDGHKVEGEDQGYSIAFDVDAGVKRVDVYYTQDYTTTSEEGVTTTVSRDGDTGEPDSTGAGQVNFRVILNDDYTLSGVAATEGTYKAIKDPSETGATNTYRITKITGDTTVTVHTEYSALEHTIDGEPSWEWAEDFSSATASFTCSTHGEELQLAATVSSELTAPDTITFTASVSIGGQLHVDTRTAAPFTATFALVNDTYPNEKPSVGTEAVFNVYNTQSYTTPSSSNVATAVARAGSTGNPVVDGTGQVNFTIVPASGYSVASVQATNGTFANVKDVSTGAGVANTYRITKITSDTTITVALTQAIYTVEFDSNGHGTMPDAQSVPHGKLATEPDNPEANGYTFGGWFTDAACTTGNEFDFTTSITEDTKLYAKWTANSYTVSFDANGGSGNIASSQVDYNGSFELPACTFAPPAGTGAFGQQFSHWTLTPDTTAYQPGDEITVVGNITVQAQWEDIVVTSVAIKTPVTTTTYVVGASELDLTGLVLSVQLSDGTSRDVVAEGNADVVASGFDTTAVAMNEPIVVSYGGQSTTFFISVHASEVTAHAITVNEPTPTAGGTVVVSAGSASEGTTIMVTPASATGYEVSAVTYTPAGGAAAAASAVSGTGAYAFAMPDVDVTVDVTFVKTHYAVNVATSTHGVVSAGGQTANYLDTVTVNATPGTGYDTYEDGVSVVDANGTAIAASDYTPLVRASDGSVTSPASWTFVMPASEVSVEVTFAPIEYGISVSVNEATGESKGSVAASVDGVVVSTAHYGDTVLLTPSVEKGYRFDSWSTVSPIGLALTVYDDGSCSFIMPATAVSVAAEFQEIEYEATFVQDGHSAVNVYYTETATTPSQVNASNTYARNPETGNLDGTGQGQVEFEVVMADGYALDTVSVDGSYKNFRLVSSSQDSRTYRYRVTKVASDLVVNIATTEAQGVNAGYKVAFDVSNATVNVYHGQDYTAPAEANVVNTLARNATTGAIDVTGEGQVNFTVQPASGYEVYKITVTDGTYKNIKNVSAASGLTNTYRVTKITADTTITIQTRNILTSGYQASLRVATGSNQYSVTFSLFDIQDYTVAPRVKSSTVIAYARDEVTGAIDVSGEGQVNFMVVPAAGYTITNVNVSGSYKNLKGPNETGVPNAYRVTKVSATNLIISVSTTYNPTTCTHALSSGQEPTWTWASDYSSATASYTCANCGEQVEVAGSVASELLDQKTLQFTATAAIGGVDYSATAKSAPFTAMFAVSNATLPNDTSGDGAVFNVYYTQDYTKVDDAYATSAVARDSATGQPVIDGSGQVNFTVVPQPGYSVNKITVTGGTYKSLKDVSIEAGAAHTYRITKVSDNTTVNVVLNQETREVSFEANGHGTAPATQTVGYGRFATEPEEPQATGYIFEGWYTDSACTEGNEFDFAATPITANTKLFAKWRTTTVDIIYRANGGSGDMPTQSVFFNIETPLNSNTFTRTGYTFKGWSTTAAGMVEYDDVQAVTLTKSLELFAVWELNTYTIGGDVRQAVVAYGNTFTIAPPTRAGYVFTGWRITGMDSTAHVYGGFTTTSTSIASTTATTFRNLRATSGMVTFTAQWRVYTPPAPVQPVATITMFRLYSPYTSEHFYTSDAAERDQLVGYGWRYEGVGWEAPVTSNTPVYRLYSPFTGDHHYTTDASEHDMLVGYGWRDEGIGWYSADTSSRLPNWQAKPLYRMYAPFLTIGQHHYTQSTDEVDFLVQNGWKAEGIGWYAS